METIIRIMESLVAMNKWTVTRFYIKAYDYGYGIKGYVGRLEIIESDKTLIIRGDGSFEFLED